MTPEDCRTKSNLLRAWAETHPLLGHHALDLALRWEELARAIESQRAIKRRLVGDNDNTPHAESAPSGVDN